MWRFGRINRERKNYKYHYKLQYFTTSKFVNISNAFKLGQVTAFSETTWYVLLPIYLLEKAFNNPYLEYGLQLFQKPQEIPCLRNILFYSFHLCQLGLGKSILKHWSIIRVLTFFRWETGSSNYKVSSNYWIKAACMQCEVLPDPSRRHPPFSLQPLVLLRMGWSLPSPPITKAVYVTMRSKE